MNRIARDSLLTLEAYTRQRKEFRAKVIAHKKNRTVRLGQHVTLIFEDELTVRYQIQEMLRIEKTFEEAGIQDELDAYTPLIPDGANLKATMMIEYEDPAVTGTIRMKNAVDWYQFRSPISQGSAAALMPSGSHQSDWPR
jgi:hypothetical protein